MAHSKETSSQQSLGDAAGAKEDTTAKATITYHDLPTAVYKVVRGWNARTNISKSVVGSSSSVPLGRNGFDACFELLVHLIPLQQGTLRTGDARDA